MDTLVAKYSRPAFHNEDFKDETEELMNTETPLSLKFAMPPVAHVSIRMHMHKLQTVSDQVANHS
jgi:20S proteasome subunit beta 5